MFDPAVGRAFNFTREDLETNRRGELSADQAAMWSSARTAARRHRRRAGIWVPAVFVVAAVVVAGGISATGGSAVAAAVAGVLLAWVGGLLMWGLRRNREAEEALSDGRPRSAEGPFEWTTTSGGFWVGTVGDARFGVDRLATEALEVGAVYRVNWLPAPQGAWVLSVERVGDPPAA